MLWDNPPHVCDTYTAASGTDAGGGVQVSYTLAQSDVPCLINTASASEQERFAAMQIVVTHRIAFKTSVLTTPLARGMKIVSEGYSFHVRGINGGQQVGSIPPLIYAECEQLL